MVNGDGTESNPKNDFNYALMLMMNNEGGIMIISANSLIDSVMAIVVLDKPLKIKYLL